MGRKTDIDWKAVPFVKDCQGNEVWPGHMVAYPGEFSLNVSLVYACFAAEVKPYYKENPATVHRIKVLGLNKGWAKDRDTNPEKWMTYKGHVEKLSEVILVHHDHFGNDLHWLQDQAKTLGMASQPVSYWWMGWAMFAGSPFTLHSPWWRSGESLSDGYHTFCAGIRAADKTEAQTFEQSGRCLECLTKDVKDMAARRAARKGKTW